MGGFFGLVGGEVNVLRLLPFLHKKLDKPELYYILIVDNLVVK